MDSKFNDAVTMTPEERLDALSEVLAEGLLYLSDKGLLKEVVEGPNSGSKKPGRNGLKSPCFPSKDPLSFHADEGKEPEAR